MHSKAVGKMVKSSSHMRLPAQTGNFPLPTTVSGNPMAYLPSRKPDLEPGSLRRWRRGHLHGPLGCRLRTGFVAKVGGWQQTVDDFVRRAAGFDPPALTLHASPTLQRRTKPGRVAVARPALRVAAGSERWRPEQIHPGHLVGRAVEAVRA